MIPWTEEFRKQYQHNTRYGNHIAVCGLAGTKTELPEAIAYPNVSKEYAPVDECGNRNELDSGSRQAISQFNLDFVAFIVVSSAAKLWR